MAFKVTFISPGVSPSKRQFLESYNLEVQGSSKECAKRFEISVPTLYLLLREFNIPEIGKYKNSKVRGPASSIYNFIDIQGAINTKQRQAGIELLTNYDKNINATPNDIGQMLKEANLNSDVNLFLSVTKIKSVGRYQKEQELRAPIKFYNLKEIREVISSIQKLRK